MDSEKSTEAAAPSQPQDAGASLKGNLSTGEAVDESLDGLGGYLAFAYPRPGDRVEKPSKKSTTSER